MSGYDTALLHTRVAAFELRIWGPNAGPESSLRHGSFGTASPVWSISKLLAAPVTDSVTGQRNPWSAPPPVSLIFSSVCPAMLLCPTCHTLRSETHKATMMSSGLVVSAVFLTRKPTLSPEEFADHWENKHVPLLKSLSGPRFPLSHTRYHLSRSPSAPDYPLNLVTEHPRDFDFDAFAVVTFASEAALKEFAATLSTPEVIEDEARFTVREKLRVVILGSINTTTRS